MPDCEEVVLTKGEVSVHQAFHELALSEAFQRKISRIQGRFNLPLFDPNSGYKPISFAAYTKKLGQKKFQQLKREILALAEEYGYCINFDVLDPFLDLVFYDGVHELVFTHCNWSTVTMEDRNDHSHPQTKNRHHERSFPVALYLSPYATQNELLDFLKRNFKAKIQPILKTYKKKESKIGKVRLPNYEKVQRRDDIIYVLEGKGHKDIAETLKLMGLEMPDQGALCKIRWKERQKRK